MKNPVLEERFDIGFLKGFIRTAEKQNAFIESAGIYTCNGNTMKSSGFKKKRGIHPMVNLG
jgi:hypothetical protein